MKSLKPQNYSRIVDASPAAMILVDQDGVICLANQAAQTLFDYSEDELLGKPVEMLVPVEAQALHQRKRAEFFHHPQIRSMGSGRFLHARRRDGSQFPAEVGLAPVNLNEEWFTLSLVIDLSLLKQAEERVTALAKELEQANRQLARLASTDPLTGLYNRREFDEQLDQQLHLMKRMRRPISLLLIDLDDFKQYNDLHGHLAGDEALKTFAKLLSQNIRTSDIIARFGGEEFVVILPDTAGPPAMQLAERLRQAIHAHLWENEGLTISLGVATLEIADLSSFPENGQPIRLFAEADRALYHSKTNGRDRATHFSDLQLS